MDAREQIYEWLNLSFRPVANRLDIEGQVELDGVLWKLAGELAGKFSLQSS